MSLQRKTQLRRTGIARGKPLARGGPVKRVNSARARARRLDRFGERDRVAEIRSMPCVCGGKHRACTRGWSDPSHVVSRGAGGRADDIVPMSRGCHEAWHAGQVTYCETLGMTVEAMRKLARTRYATQGPDAPHPQDPT